MQPIKILLITSGYPNRWKPHSNIYVKRQVDFLEQSGLIKCVVLTPADSRKGIYARLRKYLRLMISTLYSSIRDDFDIVHAHATFPSGFIALIPMILRRKKMVITVHGGEMYSIDKKNPLFRNLICQILKSADRLIAVSQSLKDRMVTHCSIDESKIEVINMGVDLQNFTVYSKESARRDLGLRDEFQNKYVMFVGNLIKRKGVAFLLNAISEIKRENGDLKFSVYVVGSGEEESALQVLSTQLGINDLVHFVGNKPPEEVPLWMSAADLLIVPSLDEGFGLVAIESMACGTPVIASNVGGLPEFVRNGLNGFLVEPGNVKDLAQKLKMYLDDPSIFNAEDMLETATNNSLQEQALANYKIYKSLFLGTSG
jgi:glycosyltransferase involved in cell wall biosynthesis